MFQTGHGTRAFVLAGLASAGLSFLVVNKWQAAQERAQYKPVVTLVQQTPPDVVGSEVLETSKQSPLPRESLARLHTEVLAKFTTTHTSGYGQSRPVGLIGTQGGMLGIIGMIGQIGGLGGQLTGGQLGDVAHGEFGIDSSLRVRYLRSPADAIISQDLVSMILHPDPVAYVSETIPAKENLTITPTRKLDAFEVAGLGELKKGASHFVQENTDTARMFGAIRADKKCLICHGDSKEGDLIGAFSYTVRATEAAQDPSRK